MKKIEKSWPFLFSYLRSINLSDSNSCTQRIFPLIHLLMVRKNSKSVSMKIMWNQKSIIKLSSNKWIFQEGFTWIDKWILNLIDFLLILQNSLIWAKFLISKKFINNKNQIIIMFLYLIFYRKKTYIIDWPFHHLQFRIDPSLPPPPSSSSDDDGQISWFCFQLLTNFFRLLERNTQTNRKKSKNPFILFSFFVSHFFTTMKSSIGPSYTIFNTDDDFDRFQMWIESSFVFFYFIQKIKIKILYFCLRAKHHDDDDDLFFVFSFLITLILS